MIEIKTDNCYKGTRILVGNEKRNMINKMIDILISYGYQEISIPIIQLQETFSNKVGNENTKLMFNFKDRGDRDICLAPEYTVIIQKLAITRFKQDRDVKLFYVQECFRGEKPQAGRYRQFTQLGVEILNPKNETIETVSNMAEILMQSLNLEYEIDFNVTRGLDYYKDKKGFEIKCEELGSSKQVCGGGIYDGGMGFALGIDRLMLVK